MRYHNGCRRAVWAASLILALPRLAAALCDGVQFGTANSIISTRYNSGGVAFHPTLDNVLPVRNSLPLPGGSPRLRPHTWMHTRLAPCCVAASHAMPCHAAEAHAPLQRPLRHRGRQRPSRQRRASVADSSAVGSISIVNNSILPPCSTQLFGSCYATGEGASQDPNNWRVQLYLCGTNPLGCVTGGSGANVPPGFQASFPTCANETEVPSCTLEPVGELQVAQSCHALPPRL